MISIIIFIIITTITYFLCHFLNCLLFSTFVVLLEPLTVFLSELMGVLRCYLFSDQGNDTFDSNSISHLLYSPSYPTRKTTGLKLDSISMANTMIGSKFLLNGRVYDIWPLSSPFPNILLLCLC